MSLSWKSIWILIVILLCGEFTFAQRKDSSNLVSPLRYSSNQLWAPGVLMGAGVFTSLFFKNSFKYYFSSERTEHLPDFHVTADNYLQYAPIPIAYALDFVGIKSKTDFQNRSVILLKAEIMTIAATNLLKYTTHERRPDGSSNYSFPSGHTSQAFTAATFLSEEYKDRFPWMPYVAYSMATATGVLRMANNRHYIGDVLFGAGVGILSMKVSYWTHQYKWGKKHHHVDYDY